jgi:hypothetical protein
MTAAMTMVAMVAVILAGMGIAAACMAMGSALLRWYDSRH